MGCLILGGMSWGPHHPRDGMWLESLIEDENTEEIKELVTELHNLVTHNDDEVSSLSHANMIVRF